MSRIRTKNEAKKIVEKYAKELRINKFPFEAIYLFGSFARNKVHKWSDVDVAVISDELKTNWDKKEDLLWHIRRKVNSRIEPIGFTVKDFQDENDPMVYEIKKNGIRIV